MKNAVIIMLFGLGLSVNAQTVIVENEKSAPTNEELNLQIQTLVNELQTQRDLEEALLVVDSVIFEYTTRPITLMQGILNAGIEKSMGKQSSIVFDGAAGYNRIFTFGGLIEPTFSASFMIGVRYYFNEGFKGVYLTPKFRARLEYGEPTARINFLVGSKWISDNNKMTFSSAFGIARTSNLGLLPSWSFIAGYRL